MSERSVGPVFDLDALKQHAANIGTAIGAAIVERLASNPDVLAHVAQALDNPEHAADVAALAMAYATGDTADRTQLFTVAYRQADNRQTSREIDRQHAALMGMPIAGKPS